MEQMQLFSVHDTKFQQSVHNFFNLLNVHQRINIRTWYRYSDSPSPLRTFHEQISCKPDWTFIDCNGRNPAEHFYNDYYEYSWRQGYTKNE